MPGTRGLRGAQPSPAENLTGLRKARSHKRLNESISEVGISRGWKDTRLRGVHVARPSSQAASYLRGVLGLPMIRRGERIFGSKENFSLMFSRTDGATYVKPWTENRDGWGGGSGLKRRPVMMMPAEEESVRSKQQRGSVYQKGLIGALAEGGVVRAVHWRLAGELGVELTHVFS